MTRRSRPAHGLIGIGGVLLLVGVVLLALPTSTHQDIPGVGEDIFFDCGRPLYPGTRPAEEPGIAACRELNASVLRHGLVLMAVGVVMTVGGGALRPRRTPASG